MKKIGALILGAGLAGLTAAWHLQQRGVDVRVLEAAAEAGGTLALSGRDGFCFDAGIHVLHTADGEILSFLQNDLGLPLATQRHRAFFTYDGKIIPYPFQVNTYCLPPLDRLRVFVESLLPRFKSPANYAEFLNLNFGPTLARHFFTPYTRKFWTVDPHELTLEWVEQRVPLPRLAHRLQGLFGPVRGEYGPNAVFYYPQRGGMASLAGTLAAALGDQITYHARVKSILPIEQLVSCEQGGEYHYHTCITTLPLPQTISMLQPVPTALLSAAAGLRHTAMCCLNIAMEGSLPHDYHWVYFPAREEPMARVHFPANLSPANVPPACTSLQIEIACRGGVRLQEMEPPAVYACLRRLQELGLIRSFKHKLLFVEQHLVDPAYVIYDHYRKRQLPAMLGYTLACGLIPAGRFGLWGYHWMHDSILSGQAAAAAALTRLGL